MNAICLDREAISLARVCHACLKKVSQKTGETVTVESVLPIVAPEKFAGQTLKCSLTRKFFHGGEFGALGSTLDELTQAAQVVFAKLEPLAIKGFKENGKPNAYAYVASVALGMMKQGGGHE